MLFNRKKETASLDVVQELRHLQRKLDLSTREVQHLSEENNRLAQLLSTLIKSVEDVVDYLPVHVTEDLESLLRSDTRVDGQPIGTREWEDHSSHFERDTALSLNMIKN